MRIQRIHVKNFRSIEDIEINTNHFSILVGQNNHGKTNFLNSINWFYLGGSTAAHQRQGTSEPPYVEVEFDGVEEALSKMKNEKNQKTLSSKLKGLQSVTLIRTVDDEGKSYRKILKENGELVDPGTGFDKALNDFLPNIEFVQTENNLRDVLKYGKTTQIGTMLSGVLNEILASGDKEYRDFVEQFYKLFGSKESKIYEELHRLADSVRGYLQKQFPETTDVEFEVKNPELTDLFKNFSARVDDGVVTEAYDKGDGMQRALMLAIIQTFADYRRKNADIKNFIFLVDEGELHLHPGAQRNLKSALEELSINGDQIFLTTHSSVLINDEKADGTQSIFKVEKYADKTTGIEQQDDYEKQNVVYELLGGSPTDLLLPSNFLIVEGPSDVDFISRVISRHYPEMKNIKILAARGDFNESVQLVSALEKLFTPFSESIYVSRYQVLIDRSKISNTQFSDLLRRIPSFGQTAQLHELPVGSIEEYYPLRQAGQCDDASDSRTYMPTWTFSADDVKGFSSKKKRRTARCVGDAITKEQFENEMAAVHEALKATYDNKI